LLGGMGWFWAAAAGLVASRRPAGSISFLITGDEEGPAVNGTRKLVAWLKEHREAVDACLVGEPTNPQHLGETIKIGRRGSLTGWLTVQGVQGHVAYPERADNPIPRLLAMLSALSSEPLDGGTEAFEPSRLVISTVDVGNPTPNVIPAEARATFNIRFNNHHTASSLTAWIERKLGSVGGAHRLEVRSDAAAFVTQAGPFTELVESVIERELGITPELSTSGGTSDARFIRDLCPVVEFGLVGATIHQVDERVALADLETLTQVYQAVLTSYVKTT
jgi:succinyl-diaminopimelate desuccinylase